jgi:hypothetical protein
MSGLYRKGVSCFNELRQKLVYLVIRDVPEDYQSCEFDCRELNCSTGDWEKCERRLHLAAEIQKQA